MHLGLVYDHKASNFDHGISHDITPKIAKIRHFPLKVQIINQHR